MSRSASQLIIMYAHDGVWHRMISMRFTIKCTNMGGSRMAGNAIDFYKPAILQSIIITVTNPVISTLDVKRAVIMF